MPTTDNTRRNLPCGHSSFERWGGNVYRQAGDLGGLPVRQQSRLIPARWMSLPTALGRWAQTQGLR